MKIHIRVHKIPSMVSIRSHINSDCGELCLTLLAFLITDVPKRNTKFRKLHLFLFSDKICQPIWVR
jgi:hypothetical protein